MKIHGVDASLTSTGIARTNDLVTDKVSTMSIESKKKGVERLIEIRQEVFKEVMYSGLVVIESYAFSRPNQAHQIGELGGVLRVMLYEHNIKFLEVAPTQLKKFATGKHNASKEEIAVAAYKKWGIECRTNDETDAAISSLLALCFPVANFFS